MSTVIKDENLNKAKELFVKSLDYQNSGYLLKAIECLEEAFNLVPVSYTHLTLPTKA